MYTHSKPGQCRDSISTGYALSAIAICGSVLLAGCSDEREPRALSASEIERCKTITKPEIIDVATREIAQDISRLSRELNRTELGGALPEESIPSESAAYRDLMNANCCRILDKIPGDYDRDVQKLGELKDGFIRLYAVEVNYEINPAFKHNRRRNVMLINCNGHPSGGLSFSLHK